MATPENVKTDGKKRHSSYLRACCPEKHCEEDIYTLHEWGGDHQGLEIISTPLLGACFDVEILGVGLVM